MIPWAIVLGLGVAQSSDQQAQTLMIEIIGDKANPCAARIDGTMIGTADDAALKRSVESYDRRTSKVVLDAARAGDHPYRCIGGWVYTLQRHGFTGQSISTLPSIRPPAR